MIHNHVNDSTRRAVWEMLCDLERTRRYYRILEDRQKSQYRVLRYTLLLLCIGECGTLGAALVWPVPALVAGGFVALILAILTVLDSMTNYGEVATEARVASHICDNLQSGCQSLWLDIEAYRVSQGDAQRRLEEIDAQWSQACQRVSIELHALDNFKAAIAAHNIIAEQYGGEKIPSV